MSLNVEDLAIHSILPVRCGSKHGTAFVIDEHHLLTAWHVVSSYFDEDQEEIVVGNGKEGFSCSAIKLGNADVILLETVSLNGYYIPLKLLSSTFKKNLPLSIIGYPQELGNGIDIFHVKVQNLRKLPNSNKGFDTLVSRKDELSFHSYQGFSGSPVINGFGHVIGVVTDQLHNSLGYTSIYSVVYLLKNNSIVVNENGDEEDTTDYGLGYSIQYNKHARLRAGNRYNKFNVSNEDIENNLSWICNVELEKGKKRILERLSDWYNKLPNDMSKTVKDEYKQPVIFNEIDDDLLIHLESLMYTRPTNKSLREYAIYGEKRHQLEKISDDVQIYLNRKHDFTQNNPSFFCIYGPAGCGKTHSLCQVTKDLACETRIYLFFGLDFVGYEEPIKQIYRILGWKEECNLEGLYERLKRDNLHATFIFDGLNEGVGTSYWQQYLDTLKDEFGKYTDVFHVIISLRETDNNDIWWELTKDWIHLRISGFEMPYEAINQYFDEFHIPIDAKEFYRIEGFKSPLFINAFCKGFRYLNYNANKKLNPWDVYQAYVKYRNILISSKVDDDPIRNATDKMLVRLADRSVSQYKCLDVPHEKAVSISYSICRMRTWSKSLLFNLIEETILREYETKQGNHKVSYEYDEMGDYYKAHSILHQNKSLDYEVKRAFLRYAESLNVLEGSEQQTVYNALAILLSIWNPEKSVWKELINESPWFPSLMFSAMPKRQIEGDTLSSEIVQRIFDKYPKLKNLHTILESSIYTNEGFINAFHNELKQMTMLQRDSEWSIQVNKMLDRHAFPYDINRTAPTDEKKFTQFCILLSWMLTSSHPGIRSVLIRIIKSIISVQKQIANALIENFHDVNDPYVLRGIFAAIYGCLLRSNDNEFISSVAKDIYNNYYLEDNTVPYDIELRSWTLRILNYAYCQDNNNDYWTKVDLNIHHDINLFNFPQQENTDEDNYFGESRGAQRLQSSLFHLDFYRYVIGGNSNNNSRVYFDINDHGISLKDIAHACANIIRDEYRYSDYQSLNDYDEKLPYDYGTDKQYERFGKKYQWLALSKVKAYMCDTYKVNKDYWSSNYNWADDNYPWYDDRASTFDPTFNIDYNSNDECSNLFEDVQHTPTLDIPIKEWLKDNKKYLIPHIKYADRQGNPWIFLVGYDHEVEKEPTNEKNYRNQHLIYNSFFVKRESYDELKEWAQQQSFYGRWMPEDRGQYHFLWNEYPWCDTYQSKKETYEEEETPKGSNIKVRLSYTSQLQENFEGVYPEGQEDVLFTAYIVREDFYDRFRLYNAERGIIREIASDEIKAIHFKLTDDGLNGLMVRKDMLDTYLMENNYVLFYSLVGEKYLEEPHAYVNMSRYSGCLCYQSGTDEAEVIQPMTEEKELIK